MDSYTILCTELRGSAQSLNGNIETLQDKADKLQKAINKVTRGDYNYSDLSSAYTAQSALTGSITRLGEICGAMNTAALQFSEASTELSGRANLTAYYMQHTDTLSYEGLMGTFTAAIASAGSAAAGYELVKSTLEENGYSVSNLGSVSNAVQDAIQREAEEQARRAEEAKWAKISLTGLVIVGGIVASVVTGGAAAPIVIGAISGAVMAGGNTVIDQYAEHGWNTENWDYAEIGKDAFVGGVTGAATAWIGGTLTKGVTILASSTQWGSTLLNSSNAYVRVGTGAVIGSASEVVSGVGSRGTGAFITTMIETDGDMGKSLSDAVEYAFDGKEIAQDAVLGGLQGGKQQYSEWKQSTAVNTPVPVKDAPPDGQFAPDVELEQDRLSDSRYFSKGDHFEEYRDFWENGSEYEFVRSDSQEVTYVRAKDIEGVYVYDSEIQNPNGFWTRNGLDGWSQDNIMNKASNISEVRTKLDAGMTLDGIAADPAFTGTVNSYFASPVEVEKVGDFYTFVTDGRHRTIAAQSIDAEIPVIIKGEYVHR